MQKKVSSSAEDGKFIIAFAGEHLSGNSERFWMNEWTRSPPSRFSLCNTSRMWFFRFFEMTLLLRCLEEISWIVEECCLWWEWEFLRQKKKRESPFPRKFREPIDPNCVCCLRLPLSTSLNILTVRAVCCVVYGRDFESNQQLSVVRVEKQIEVKWSRERFRLAMRLIIVK